MKQKTMRATVFEIQESSTSPVILDKEGVSRLVLLNFTVWASDLLMQESLPTGWFKLSNGNRALFLKSLCVDPDTNQGHLRFAPIKREREAFDISIRTRRCIWMSQWLLDQTDLLPNQQVFADS